MECHQTFAS
jgi:hypothetical protein